MENIDCLGLTSIPENLSLLEHLQHIQRLAQMVPENEKIATLFVDGYISRIEDAGVKEKEEAREFLRKTKEFKASISSNNLLRLLEE